MKFSKRETNRNTDGKTAKDDMSYDFLKFCIEVGASTPAVSYRCNRAADDSTIIVNCVVCGGAGPECTMKIIMGDDFITLTRIGGGCAFRTLKYPSVEGKCINLATCLVQGLGSEVLVNYLKDEYPYPKLGKG